MNIDEIFLRASQLSAKQFGDAPRELNTTISLAMDALKHSNHGDALNLLNRAHDLVKAQSLDDWMAEVAAAWAVYYFHTGENQKMHQAINYAQSKEPNNKRIAALKRVISDTRHGNGRSPSH